MNIMILMRVLDVVAHDAQLMLNEDIVRIFGLKHKKKNTYTVDKVRRSSSVDVVLKTSVLCFRDVVTVR